MKNNNQNSITAIRNWSIGLCLLISIVWFFYPCITDWSVKHFHHDSSNSTRLEEGTTSKEDSLLIAQELNIPEKNSLLPLLVKKIEILQDEINELKKDKIDTPTKRGTFGDMFGSLNTLFSGLGMVGLLATILIQITIHNYEKSEKLKVENSKIIFMGKVLEKFRTDFLDKFKPSVDRMLTILDGELKHFENFKPNEYDDSLLSILKKIDFEEYYLLYEDKGKDGTNLIKIQGKLIELQNMVENYNLNQESFFNNLNLIYSDFNQYLSISITTANTSQEDYLKYYSSSLDKIQKYLPILRIKGNETENVNWRNDFNLNYDKTVENFEKLSVLVKSYREQLEAHIKLIDDIKMCIK